MGLPHFFELLKKMVFHSLEVIMVKTLLSTGNSCCHFLLPRYLKHVQQSSLNANRSNDRNPRTGGTISTNTQQQPGLVGAGGSGTKTGNKKNPTKKKERL